MNGQIIQPPKSLPQLHRSNPKIWPKERVKTIPHTLRNALFKPTPILNTYPFLDSHKLTPPRRSPSTTISNAASWRLHICFWWWSIAYFSLVYRLNDCSMFKHPGIYAVWCCCFVSLKKGQKSSMNQFESTHHSLNQFNKVSDFMWIDSCMYRLFSILNRLTKLFDLSWIDSYEVWIVSIFILGTLESTQIWFESYHPSYFSGLFFGCLNRFKHLVNRFNLLNCAKIESFHSSLYIHSSPLFQKHWIICIYSL